ncbi:DNA-binding CsgD family transcriptional regulator [Actinoplanes tereljensis]|uniref:LuxR family transcriptional regulator n=1 Tax=Paractinoplanes tereljensis TaxID=571912 RepID=A0A919TQ88_9ACTN|nr:LuxR family transcriptional regulator [Actinoplanes tereljensis]GIF18036.1 LuxR family transcriptional regulator [Actinoplanes tereljensis]
MDSALSSPILVGRDDLVALASRRLAAAEQGSGELLFLAGEAGIGKTRLLSEIVRRAGGFTVVGAGASPGDAEVAGAVLADLGAEMRRNPATATAGAGVSRRLREFVDGDADRQRRLLVADLTALIAAAVSGPLLVTVEDLHWADDLTLDVLARLGRRATELPLLLVGTYRSDELYPRVPMRAWRTRLLTQRHAEEVRLTRLSLADTAAMTAAIAGGSLPGSVTGDVFVRSDGIPLHVEEFLASRESLPDTLADAVLARAFALSEPSRRLAEVASVLGRSFDLDLLTALTGDGPAVVDDGLRELSERFFVQAHPDRSTFDFRHALIRDALYADLSPHRRRELHARAAAAAVEAGFPAAFVSDQYERAALAGPAFEFASSAASAAVEMSAHREAVELYRRAQRTAPVALPVESRAALLTALAGELAAVDDNVAAAACFEEAYRLRLKLDDRLAAAMLVPDWVAVRHQLGADLDERAAALRGALPLIAFRTDSLAQEARANIHAALAAAYMLDRRLGEAIEDGEFARSIAVEDCDRAMRCNLDATLGAVFLFAGRLSEGRELLEGSIARAQGWRFEGQTARGYRMLGSSMSVLVEYETARKWLPEGIAYAERVEQINDRNYLTAHLGHVMWATGDWVGAESAARQALADGGGITTRITALHVLGYVAMGRGAPATAVDHLGEAASLGSGMRELQRVSPAWWGLAEVALLGGDFGTAVQRCEEGFEASARVRDAAYLFPYVVTGVRAHLALSGPTAAREWFGRAAELLNERDIPGTRGAIPHARGLIHLYEGQTGKARAELAEAAEFWAGRSRFWEGAAALVDQARCAARSRRAGDAAEFMATARDAYGRVGAPIPGYLSAPAPSRSAVPSLSARELEVARLVAAGMTNREIAEKLVIAPKTAAAHVEHIRTKLGVSRRAQIAAWVATLG